VEDDAGQVTITVFGPDSEADGTQLSDPPLGRDNKYRIVCPDLEDETTLHQTDDLKLNLNEFWIEDALSKNIPHLSFGVSVFRPVRKYTNENTGLQIVITVERKFGGNIPDCYIEPADEGNNPYPADFAE